MHFLVHFYGPKWCAGAPKLTNMRYASVIFFQRSKPSRWTVQHDLFCKWSRSRWATLLQKGQQDAFFFLKWCGSFGWAGLLQRGGPVWYFSPKIWIIQMSRISLLPAQVRNCEMEYKVLMDIEYLWILHIYRYWIHIDIAHMRKYINRISFLSAQVGDFEIRCDVLKILIFMDIDIDIAHPRCNIIRISFLPAKVGDCEMEYINIWNILIYIYSSHGH